MAGGGDAGPLAVAVVRARSGPEGLSAPAHNMTSGTTRSRGTSLDADSRYSRFALMVEALRASANEVERIAVRALELAIETFEHELESIVELWRKLHWRSGAGPTPTLGLSEYRPWAYRARSRQRTDGVEGMGAFPSLRS